MVRILAAKTADYHLCSICSETLPKCCQLAHEGKCGARVAMEKAKTQAVLKV